ncbi:DNA-binding protein [Prevotella intermedia]|uniref:DNA-binding protein n=1 Tax=Prevotella intermedia TaxID=28131 RepID=A0A2G8I9D7_PREIN|nr:DNA-binding protein [Prevotella intermedia]PIK20110.1 DNA-binding protein [Prevotella intermedia]
MIRYKIYENKNKKSAGYKKFYARAVSEETINLRQLADYMATHNVPFSKGCIYGVLRDMVACIKEIIIDGKNVKIDDLAIFSAGLRTSGAETLEGFNPAKNIKNIKLRSRATGVLRTPKLTGDANVREFALYTIAKKKKQKSGEGESGTSPQHP